MFSLLNEAVAVVANGALCGTAAARFVLTPAGGHTYQGSFTWV